MNETIPIPEQAVRTVIWWGGFPTVCCYKVTINDIVEEVLKHNEHIKSVQVTFIWFTLNGWPVREVHYLNVREKFLYD